MGKPRVILADRESMLCTMIAQILQPEFEVISMVSDGPSLIAAASLAPDVVILDVGLPRISGALLVNEVLHVSPVTKIVILTMNDDENVAADVLAAGATAYLLKTAALEELPAAIREVLRGNTYITPSLAVKLAGVRADPGVQTLTRREQEVVQLLTEGKPMREIAEILQLTPRTVAFHKYRIMKKLGVRSSAELIRYALSRLLVR